MPFTKVFKAISQVPKSVVDIHPTANSPAMATDGEAVTGISGAFVRFFHGGLPFRHQTSPLHRGAALNFSFNQNNYKDVSLESSHGKGDIEHRTTHAILNHAPADTYAFQIFQKQTLKTAFLNRVKSRDLADSGVFWIGEAAVHNDVVTLITPQEDLVRLDPDEVVVSREGKQVWPKLKPLIVNNVFQIKAAPSLGQGH